MICISPLMIPISFGVYEALTFGCSKWLGRWGVKFEFGLATNRVETWGDVSHWASQ